MLRTSASIVSLDFTEGDEKDEKSSKLKSFYDKNQITIYIIKIYAGVISIVFEGNYLQKFLTHQWLVILTVWVIRYNLYRIT